MQRPVIPIQQSRAIPANCGQFTNPAPQVKTMFLILQSCKVESRAQIPVIRLFESLKAKLTAIIDRGQARKLNMSA